MLRSRMTTVAGSCVYVEGVGGGGGRGGRGEVWSIFFF